MKKNKLYIAAALLTAAALLSGCGSSAGTSSVQITPADTEATSSAVEPEQSASSETTSSEAASSKAASSKAASSKAASSKAASSKAEPKPAQPSKPEASSAPAEDIFKSSYNAIPSDAFKFSTSSYSGSDFSWYSETTGTGFAAQVRGIYRYNDYLVALLEHADGNAVNAYRETRLLTASEGERFLKNAASFLYKQTIEDPGISGGRFARYELKLNGQSVNEVEEIDISFIDFGDEYYDGFQYDSDSWADGNFAYNDITNFTSFQESERINNWSTGDHIKMYGTTTDGLMCVVAQLKDIVDFPFIVRGGTSIEYNGDTAKAGFYLIHVGDEPIANSPGAMYYVTFNYYSLVLSVEKVND